VSDDAWCRSQLQTAIEALDWVKAREDVRRFLRPAEARTLDLWSAGFFDAQCRKIGAAEGGG
jgi:hypothetical protein